MKVSAVWTALPNGSKIAATSRSIPAAWCQTFVIGSEMQLGEGARPVDADAAGVGAEVAPAGHAVATAAADDVALAADDVADGGQSLTFEPTSTTSPTNSWPITSGAGTVACGPGVPGLDVQVGAADAGPLDRDQHIVDPHLGLGYVQQTRVPAPPSP